MFEAHSEAIKTAWLGIVEPAVIADGPLAPDMEAIGVAFEDALATDIEIGDFGHPSQGLANSLLRMFGAAETAAVAAIALVIVVDDLIGGTLLDDDRIAVRGRLARLMAGVMSALASIESARRPATTAGQRDELTGLLRSDSFALDFQRLEANAEVFVMGVIDVDGLKVVNDREGHLAGNQVLQRVATALSVGLPANGQVYRWGGDEFALLLAVQSIEEAIAWTDSLEAAGAPPFSRGFSMYPMDATDINELFQIADVRMYENKRARKA